MEKLDDLLGPLPGVVELSHPDQIIGFSAEDRLDLSSLSLGADSIQMEQLNPSSWMLFATGTDLAVEIRTGQIGFEQILMV